MLYFLFLVCRYPPDEQYEKQEENQQRYNGINLYSRYGLQVMFDEFQHNSYVFGLR